MEIIKYNKVFYVKDVPEGYTKHIAFAGKSNVGKSSLLNALFNRRNLAPTSSKPGKTRGLNLYIAGGRYIICDLPGYGYASFSKAQREQFLILSADYFKQYSECLFLFVLIDIRRHISDLDLSLLNYAGRYNIPYGIVLTKTDKISRNKHNIERERIISELKENQNLPDRLFFTSAKTRTGISELYGFFSSLINDQ